MAQLARTTLYNDTSLKNFVSVIIFLLFYILDHYSVFLLCFFNSMYLFLLIILFLACHLSLFIWEVVLAVLSRNLYCICRTV